MSRSEVRLPASQIVAARAYVLVLAILGQLGASNNWSRIVREVLYDEPPVTDLGPSRGGVAAERGSASAASRARDPAAAVEDRRMAEQVEVGEAAQLQAAVDLERNPPAAAVARPDGARHAHEQIAKQRARRASGLSVAPTKK